MNHVPEEVTDWCRAFATAVGVDPPTDQEIDDLLALAGVAAHSSARQSAPITCWLAARAGMVPSQALATAEEIANRRLP
ncbi:MAG: hypothetical protein QOH79_1590 [Acidimicrobiaceae bacterium]|jgi:hypothetical protein